MKPEDIPQELVDILNERAGKIHKRDGYAIEALAEILTRYDEMKAQELHEMLRQPWVPAGKIETRKSTK